jgi:hypothetical protein
MWTKCSGSTNGFRVVGKMCSFRLVASKSPTQPPGTDFADVSRLNTSFSDATRQLSMFSKERATLSSGMREQTGHEVQVTLANDSAGIGRLAGSSGDRRWCR